MSKGIVILGEALIDFLPTDNTNLTYEKNPGGAPANVAVGVSRLGASSTLISKVGKDTMGCFLKDTLKNNKVEVKYILETEEAKTNIVIVSLDSYGERKFEFFVQPSADQLLNEKDIEETAFNNKKIFHFGSITLIQEPSLSATKKAIEIAQKKGLIISYDPNIRLSLWQSTDIARKTIMSVLSQVDILKVSEEELEFITGEKDFKKSVYLLKQQYNIKIIFVTLGSKGSYVFNKESFKHVKSLKIDVVDTTGSGDGFVSGMLYNINEFEGILEDISIELAEEITRFANITGGIVATTKGAIPGLPTKDEVTSYQL